MANALTDQYQLVRTSTVDASFLQNLLGKTINYNDGFVRELFRDGRRIGSIYSHADTVQARRGDTLLSVNMGIVTVPFTDQLATRDGYTMTYDGTVRLRVWDPRTFAVCYQQGIDPLQKALDAIRAALLREIARTVHDNVTDAYLRNVVEYEVAPRQPAPYGWGLRDAALVAEYGVAILDAQTMVPRADPKRVAEIAEIERVQREQERLERERQIKLAELRQQENIRLAELRKQEATQREELRVTDELARQQRVIDERTLKEQLADEDARKDFERVQMERDAIVRIRIREQDVLNDAAVQIRIAEAQERRREDRALLRRLREQGVSTDRIVREYPELTYLFERRDLISDQIVEAPPTRQIREPATPAGEHRSDAGESQQSYGVVSEPHPDDEHTLSHLGIKVSRHELTDQEMSWSGATSHLAYFIEDVLPDWEGDQQLRKGDFIFALADTSVPELPELAVLLDSLQSQDSLVKVTLLRGTVPVVVYVTIPPMTQR